MPNVLNSKHAEFKLLCSKFEQVFSRSAKHKIPAMDPDQEGICANKHRSTQSEVERFPNSTCFAYLSTIHDTSFYLAFYYAKDALFLVEILTTFYRRKTHKF